MAAAAYRAGVELVDERTGLIHDYTRRGGVVSAELVLPDGGTVDRSALWNAAEVAERRKDSRTAREWVVALPAELAPVERAKLARDFGAELASRYGVAVDVAIHAPDREGDNRNHHAHLLTTTRQVSRGADGALVLGAKTAIELGDRDRAKAGIEGRSADDITELRARWASLANMALERAGRVERIDPRSNADRGIELTPTTHIGVHAVAMDRKGKDAERVAEHEEVRRENAAKIEENPALILEQITHLQAVFDRRDIARELSRYIDDPDQFQSIMARIENDPHLVQLAPEVKDGYRVIPARYSTREMIDVEQAMIDSADGLASSPTHAVDPAVVAAAIGKRESLSDEQRAAVSHVTGAARLAIIIGDAGTGKSFAMATAKEAWEAQGFRVRGCALSGKAADELQAGSGIESRTIHSLEHGWKRDKDALSAGDVLVVDESGMVGSRQLGRVLAAAERAGAKVVLLGDDKQLAAIEAGAGFRAVTERVGAAEITQIRRQRDDWARDASREFARGDIRSGLDAYAKRGGVRLLDTREAAKTALAADWLADRDGGKSSIILAHSNKDVASLNESIRAARRAEGELDVEVDYRTERGVRKFAAGDRLVFLENNRDLGVKNGSLGTVEVADSGRLMVKLDSGARVQVQQDRYAKLDHGYAVTIHKAQGVTVDRAHVLATPGMDRSLAYVGMTRHRESANLYAGQDDFGSYDKLARGLARQRPKESTLDFAERRGLDGAGVMAHWVGRGRDQLVALGNRAREALDHVLDRAGLTTKAPDLATATPAELAAMRSSHQVPTAASPGVREGGPKKDPLAKFTADVDRARAQDDALLFGTAERRLDLARGALAKGDNPAHLFSQIQQQAIKEMSAHLQAGGAAAQLAPTMRGDVPLPRPAPLQVPVPARDEAFEKKRAELQSAMNRGRDNDRGRGR